MLREFLRVVDCCAPQWFLLENVARVPDVDLYGYDVQRFPVNEAWFRPVSRLRHIQFGSRSGSGRTLHIEPRRPLENCEPAATANDGRTLAELCQLQGLPADFELPGFTVEGAKRAVGNGVPIAMGRTLARAIRSAYGLEVSSDPLRVAMNSWRRTCKCGCGLPVAEHAKYFNATCRKRAQRSREQLRRRVGL